MTGERFLEKKQVKNCHGLSVLRAGENNANNDEQLSTVAYKFFISLCEQNPKEYYYYYYCYILQ